MTRLVFSGPDLGRIRFAILPFQETLKAARAVTRRDAADGLRAWRRGVRTVLPSAARPAVAISGAHVRHLPDFLTPQPPVGAQRSFREELAAALHDPDAPVVADTTEFTKTLGRTPPLLETLLRDPQRGRRTLAHSFSAFYQAALAAQWPRLHAQLTADVAFRSRLAASQGTEAMLATLCPEYVSWEYPYLKLPEHGRADFPLSGRGLVLVPSLFLHDGVHRQLNDRQQPMLFYPALTSDAYWRDGGIDASPGRLSDVLGEHRAAMLRAVAERPDCGTGALAAVLGVSAATASHHLGRLRKGGLLATIRHAGLARHEPTALGRQLLDFHTT